MTSEELKQLVAAAFADVPRPEKFTSGCPCSECAEIDKKFKSFKSEPPANLDWKLPLLSPQAVQFLIPALIREALDDEDGDLAANFVDMLTQPISKSEPPDCLPFAVGFNREQTAAMLEFLRFIRDDWYEESEELPRQLKRGLRNWEHFVERAS